MRPDRKQMLLGLGLAFVVSIAGCAQAQAKVRHHHKTDALRFVSDANGNSVRQVIGHRPDDCPHAWCGCGLRKYLQQQTGDRIFADDRLDLAWNWQELFHRTHGRDGAVGVRHHHVVLVERHIKGTKYLVRDFNWSGGLAWLHVRDLRGFVFVDPHSRAAAL